MELGATSQTHSHCVYKGTGFISKKRIQLHKYIIWYPRLKQSPFPKQDILKQGITTFLPAFLSKTLLYIRAQDSISNQSRQLLKGHKVRQLDICCTSHRRKQQQKLLSFTHRSLCSLPYPHPLALQLHLFRLSCNGLKTTIIVLK